MEEDARRRRHWIAGAAGVVLILLLVDWPLGRHGTFWLRHPLVAVIVGGLALLRLAAALLNVCSPTGGSVSATSPSAGRR